MVMLFYVHGRIRKIARNYSVGLRILSIFKDHSILMHLGYLWSFLHVRR